LLKQGLSSSSSNSNSGEPLLFNCPWLFIQYISAGTFTSITNLRTRLNGGDSDAEKISWNPPVTFSIIFCYSLWKMWQTGANSYEVQVWQKAKQPCGHTKLKFLFGATGLGKDLLNTSARSNKFHKSVIIKRKFHKSVIKRTDKFYEIYHLSKVSNIETERKFEILTDNFIRESCNKHCAQQYIIIIKITIITL